MEDDGNPPKKQVEAVVVITLPPLDNPSLGKTITAFTLSDSDSPSNPIQSQQEHQSTIQSQSNNNRISIQRSYLYTPKPLLAFLGISIFAYFFFFFKPSFSNTLLQFPTSNRNDGDDDDDDRNRESFVFPLYRKPGTAGMEFKLGRFVDPTNQVKMATTTSLHQSSTTIFPVRGNVYPDGLYFIKILVGKSKMPYYLDVDTGSDLTWIQCDAPCVSCAKGPHPLYKPTKGIIIPSKDSMCIEVQRNQKVGYCETCLQCDYEIEYADRSSSMGVLAKDELHLLKANGSQTKFDMVFGCAYDQQGSLLTTLVKTDGILGLSRSKVSLPSQLASKGVINNVVGHCLTNDAGSGGYMFLGDDFVPYWGIVWVSMLNKPSIDFYHAEVIKISYGNRQLSLRRREREVGRVVFDSGSSYTYFTKEAYSDLIASFAELPMDELVQDISDPTLPICWRAKFPIRSVVDVKKFFKTFTLHFGSKWWISSPKLRIPPEGYLIISKKGNVCLGILDGSKVHDGSAIILGDISLRGQLVIYDNVNQKIGWTQSDCTHPQRFESLQYFTVEGL